MRTDAEGFYHMPCPAFSAVPRMVLRTRKLILRAEQLRHISRTKLFQSWPGEGESLGEVKWDFVLGPGRAAHGRVITQDGAPVSGARVMLLWMISDDDASWEAWPSTNADGLFRRTFPPEAQVRRLWVHSPHDGVALMDLSDHGDLATQGPAVLCEIVLCFH
ncbi:MAG: hypothetical protein GY809_17560, partial [Planctomycetes bacterium]|nr:hypothetical protein [Planctomycetota bacterium]